MNKKTLVALLSLACLATTPATHARGFFGHHGGGWGFGGWGFGWGAPALIEPVVVAPEVVYRDAPTQVVYTHHHEEPKTDELIVSEKENELTNKCDAFLSTEKMLEKTKHNETLKHEDHETWKEEFDAEKTRLESLHEDSELLLKTLEELAPAPEIKSLKKRVEKQEAYLNDLES